MLAHNDHCLAIWGTHQHAGGQDPTFQVAFELDGGPDLVLEIKIVFWVTPIEVTKQKANACVSLFRHSITFQLHEIGAFGESVMLS